MFIGKIHSPFKCLVQATPLIIINSEALTRTVSLASQYTHYYYSWQYCNLQQSLFNEVKVVLWPQFQFGPRYWFWHLNRGCLQCWWSCAVRCLQWDVYFGLLVPLSLDSCEIGHNNWSIWTLSASFMESSKHQKTQYSQNNISWHSLHKDLLL